MLQQLQGITEVQQQQQSAHSATFLTSVIHQSVHQSIQSLANGSLDTLPTGQANVTSTNAVSNMAYAVGSEFTGDSAHQAFLNDLRGYAGKPSTTVRAGGTMVDFRSLSSAKQQQRSNQNQLIEGTIEIDGSDDDCVEVLGSSKPAPKTAGKKGATITPPSTGNKKRKSKGKKNPNTAKARGKSVMSAAIAANPALQHRGRHVTPATVQRARNNTGMAALMGAVAPGYQAQSLDPNQQLVQRLKNKIFDASRAKDPNDPNCKKRWKLLMGTLKDKPQPNDQALYDIASQINRYATLGSDRPLSQEALNLFDESFLNDSDEE